MTHGRTTRALAIVALAGLCAAAAAGCNREPTASETRAPAAQPETAAQARTDADLSRSIQAAYYRDERLRGRDIDVSANDGVVTLRGTVPDEAAKQQAVNVAKNVEGVRSVNEELEVRQDGDQAARRDEGARQATGTTGRDESVQPTWITTKIQSQYFLNPEIRPWNIDVTTASGGVVTLEGRVESADDRAEAVRIARETEGVTRVEDRLRVGDEPKRAETERADASRDTGPADREPGDVAAFDRPDAWVTAKIQAKYFVDDEVKGRNIDVDTRDGAVTLKGAVATEAERRQAIALARNTDGVRDVTDELRIDPALRGDRETDAGRAGAATVIERPDVWITTKIQAQYFIDQDVKGRHIDVDTTEGVVTLKGTVENEQQKQQAEQIARDTEGVKRVQNQLTVGPVTAGAPR